MKSPLALCVFFGAGCAGAVSPSMTVTVAELDCVHGLDCLPEWQQAVRGPFEPLGRGGRLARRTLELPEPPGPEDLETEGPDHFEAELEAWVEQRHGALTRATRELSRVGRGEGRGGVMAHAVVGLINERAAHDLLTVPLPPRGVDERRQPLYRAALMDRARPFAQRARRAYRVCARRASGARALSSWARFCSARERYLETPESASPTRRHRYSQAEMVVEVVVDR